jgi:hypothetical protein
MVDNPGIPDACLNSVHVNDKQADNQNEKKQPKNINRGFLL